MLQQTTVAAVVPRFSRFLVAFPDLESLAAATESEVLSLWEGLGYYNRARNLHRAARILVEQHGGQFPRDPTLCAELPGVGRYILGAILSQAFGLRLPIVEANTNRLLHRLFARTGDPRSSENQRWLWQTAESILPDSDVGDFNQALMELGAIVCLPVSPRCEECPLKSGCQARKLGLQSEIPLRPARTRPLKIDEVCLVPYRGERLLLMKRPETGRWASLWEFPRLPVEAEETPSQTLDRLAGLLGLRLRNLHSLGTIRYTVLNERTTMHCWHAQSTVARFRPKGYEEGRWIQLVELETYPLSSPQRRLAEKIDLQALPSRGVR